MDYILENIAAKKNFLGLFAGLPTEEMKIAQRPVSITL